ncbi:MAG TPA: protein phosphatase 2C domain-containing protein, partial [Chloroflexota bacterium]|nr:protein phosphatase 2C domain-containing protein [Chloroflexota bacterium]
PLHTDARYFRAAVADGATETSFADIWARELVRAYGKGRLDCDRWEQSLAASRRRWHFQTSRRSLPWYGEEKRRQGAYAAIVGLKLLESGRWMAMAIGDSCLFHIRRERLIKAFPLTSSGDFGSRPRLIGSVSNGRKDDEPRIERTTGRWHLGDEFLLATDALAAWALATVEAGERPWTQLRQVLKESHQDSAELITSLRESGALRNDDVTLLRAVVS